MGNLGLNKIAGAVLATSLGLIGLQKVSNIVFAEGGGGHHGDEHHDQTLSEQMCANFAYCVEVAGGSHGGEEVEEVFDLGLLLANADASKGARVFKGQCATCHSIDAGGANGTGPNLYDIVGAGKAAKAGFAYSAALTGIGGDWTYQDLNDWLNNPSSYARGTSMSFAGLRKDPDRMNLIAYLAENTASAPAYPAPLPAAEDAPADAHGEDGAAEHGDDAALAAPDAPANEAPAADIPAPAAPADILDGPVEAAVEGAGDAIEAVVEEAQDAVEDVTGGEDDAHTGDADH